MKLNHSEKTNSKPKTKYCKNIEFELRELVGLSSLLRKSIIDSDEIGYIIENIPLYNKLEENINDLQKLELPF